LHYEKKKRKKQRLSPKVESKVAIMFDLRWYVLKISEFILNLFLSQKKFDDAAKVSSIGEYGMVIL